MKQVVTKEMFIDGFMSVRPDNFSREGLSKLFDYLQKVERDTGEELEFDPTTICYEFVEYSNAREIADDYDIQHIIMLLQAVQNFLEEHTTIVCFSPGCIIFKEF